MTTNYAGYWTGVIEGTNQGGLTLDLAQNGKEIVGTAKLSEPALGQYEYLLKGSESDDGNLILHLSPGRKFAPMELGKVVVICRLDSKNNLIGRWQSDIGTEGTFTAKKFQSEQFTDKLPDQNSVFLVHGHDEGAMHAVARFLEQIGVTPVILHEQMNRGMTIIEKFESFAKRAGFAVVLMTPDDFGYPNGKEEEKRQRPRQNVVLELGYFTALLGREKTMVLKKGDIELPSDIFGIAYQTMDNSEGWKINLAKELKQSGFDVDLNKAI